MGPLLSATCRMLNERADLEASHHARLHYNTRCGNYDKAREDACKWSALALDRLIKGAKLYYGSEDALKSKCPKWLKVV